MPTGELVVFGYRRHADSRISPAFKRVWVDPLRGRIQVRMLEHGCVDWHDVARRQPLVFFDRAPSQEALAVPGARVVWVPMWDGHTLRPQRWWNRWAQYDIKFVAYSRQVARRARRAGIRVFEIQYFDDPAELPAVPWDGERNAFYWNRAGLLGRCQLVSMCRDLELDHLFYRPDLDYYLPRSTRFSLPERIGKTRVHTVGFLPHDQYLHMLASTQLYVAPRWFEGIGVTVTEALASGCVVLANDAPTMNEYIVHGETGLFLPYNTAFRYLVRLKSKVERRLGLDRPAPSPLLHYDWSQLLRFDLAAIAQRARQVSWGGRKRYMEQLGNMVDFILSDW